MTEEEHGFKEPAVRNQEHEGSSKFSLSKNTKHYSYDDSALSMDKPTCSSDSNCNDSVPTEEKGLLRAIKPLENVRSSDDSSNDDSDSDDGICISEDLADEEIDILEEDLLEGSEEEPKSKENPYVTIKKLVLEEKGVTHLEVLPQDWIMVRHFSGMPIYVHLHARVCTIAKPYSLGESNLKGHDIPISAIPCYAYRKALEEEEKQKDTDPKIEEQIRNGTCESKTAGTTNSPQQSDINKQSNSNSNASDNFKANSDETLSVDTNNIQALPPRCSFSNGELSATGSNNEKKESNNENDEIPLNRKPVAPPVDIVMPPRIEMVNTSRTQHLTAEQVIGYCEALFKFKTVDVKFFTRWEDRRMYIKEQKSLRRLSLSQYIKLNTLPIALAVPGQENKMLDVCGTKINLL